MTAAERDALRAAWIDAASALPALRAEVLDAEGSTTLVVHGTGGITRLAEPDRHTHRALLVARALVAAVNALPELLDAADERDRLRAELLDARRGAFDEHEKTRSALRAAETERDRLQALLLNVAEHVEASWASGTNFDVHLDAAQKALRDDEPVTL